MPVETSTPVQRAYGKRLVEIRRAWFPNEPDTYGCPDCQWDVSRYGCPWVMRYCDPCWSRLSEQAVRARLELKDLERAAAVEADPFWDNQGKWSRLGAIPFDGDEAGLDDPAEELDCGAA